MVVVLVHEIAMIETAANYHIATLFAVIRLILTDRDGFMGTLQKIDTR